MTSDTYTSQQQLPEVALAVLARSKQWQLVEVKIDSESSSWRDVLLPAPKDIVQYCHIKIETKADLKFWDDMTQLMTELFQCNLKKTQLDEVEYGGKTFVCTPLFISIIHGHDTLTRELLRFHDDYWNCSECEEPIPFEVQSRLKQCCWCKNKRCQSCYYKSVYHKVIDMDMMWPLLMFKKSGEERRQLWLISCPHCERTLNFSGKDVKDLFETSVFAK